MSSAILNGGIGMFYRRQWASLFSSDLKVIDLAERTMWVMWLYTTCDALKAVGTLFSSLFAHSTTLLTRLPIGMSLLRSCGRAMPTVVGNFFSCLIAGYPISWALGFPASTLPSFLFPFLFSIAHFSTLELGLFGIWVGMSFAWLCAGSIYGWILYRTNWQEECNTARERNAVGAMSMKTPAKEKQSSKLAEEFAKDNN